MVYNIEEELEGILEEIEAKYRSLPDDKQLLANSHIIYFLNQLDDKINELLEE